MEIKKLPPSHPAFFLHPRSSCRRSRDSCPPSPSRRSTCSKSLGSRGKSSGSRGLCVLSGTCRSGQRWWKRQESRSRCSKWWFRSPGRVLCRWVQVLCRHQVLRNISINGYKPAINSTDFRFANIINFVDYESTFYLTGCHYDFVFSFWIE